MAAWKLRALVYGLLAVVAGLALAARGSASGSDDGPPRVDTLSGHTVQGTRLDVYLDGSRVARVGSFGIWARCDDRRLVGVTWYPATDQWNVTYTRHGSRFTVHERPDPRNPRASGTRSNIYMSGTISSDRRLVDGTIRYYETGPDGACESGPIPYSAWR